MKVGDLVKNARLEISFRFTLPLPFNILYIVLFVSGDKTSLDHFCGAKISLYN